MDRSLFPTPNKGESNISSTTMTLWRRKQRYDFNIILATYDYYRYFHDLCGVDTLYTGIVNDPFLFNHALFVTPHFGYVHSCRGIETGESTILRKHIQVEGTLQENGWKNWTNFGHRVRETLSIVQHDLWKVWIILLLKFNITRCMIMILAIHP